MEIAKDCTDTAVTMAVDTKMVEGGRDYCSANEAPFLSELSCTMTEASIDSLDLLSPAGTPMRNWFTCFQPKARDFEILESYPKDFRTVEFSATPVSPSIPEDSVMEFHDDESTSSNVETEESTDESEQEVVDTEESIDKSGVKADQSIEESQVDTEQSIEESRAGNNKQSIDESEVKTDQSIEESQDDAEQCIEESDPNLENPLEEISFEVQVEASPFVAEVTLTESTSESTVASTETQDVQEENLDSCISSADFVFAFVWIVLSLVVLQGFKIPLEQLRELLTVHTIDFVKGSVFPTITDATFEVAQMTNSITAEAVCAFIGSRCIA